MAVPKPEYPTIQTVRTLCGQEFTVGEVYRIKSPYDTRLSVVLHMPIGAEKYVLQGFGSAATVNGQRYKIQHIQLTLPSYTKHKWKLI